MTSAYDTLKEWLANDKLERNKKQPDPREHPKAPTPPSDKDVTNTLAAMSLGTTPLPFVPDLLGLLADVNMYRTEPESRTLENAAWTGVGLLPLVPGVVARATSHQQDVLEKLVKDHPQFKKEEKLWHAGREIFDQGLFIDKYKNIKREIPDTNLRFKSKPDADWRQTTIHGAQGPEVSYDISVNKLDDLVSHPNLERLQYLDEEDVALYNRLYRPRPIDVVIDPAAKNRSGMYLDEKGKISVVARNEDEALGVLVHELNHDIQAFQKLPEGSNAKWVKRILKKPSNLTSKGREVVVQTAKVYEPLLKQRGTAASYTDELSNMLYLNELGEVEARASQNRLRAIQSYERKKPELMEHLPESFKGLTGEELAQKYLDAKPFKQSYDVQEEFIYDFLTE